MLLLHQQPANSSKLNNSSFSSTLLINSCMSYDKLNLLRNRFTYNVCVNEASLESGLSIFSGFKRFSKKFGGTGDKKPTTGAVFPSPISRNN